MNKVKVSREWLQTVRTLISRFDDMVCDHTSCPNGRYMIEGLQRKTLCNRHADTAQKLEEIDYFLGEKP